MTPVINLTPTERYRNSRFHRKCEFCVYYSHWCIDAGNQIHELHECRCKEKYIRYPNLIRFLCTGFILNKEKCKEVDKKINKTIEGDK